MKLIENDDYPWLLEENKMPTSYVKYRDKTNEELDELIEYDVSTIINKNYNCVTTNLTSILTLS